MTGRILDSVHDRTSVRGLGVAGLAGVGVLLAHWLAYLAAVPNAALRNAVLVHTGHAYWAVAVKGASAFGFVAVMAMLGRLVGRSLPGTEPGLRFVQLAVRLTVLQVLVFTVMEIAERVAAHVPVTTDLGATFALGVGLQILIALAGALLLVWLGRVASRLVRAIRGSTLPVRRRPLLLGARAGVYRPAVLTFGAAGLRGPPA
jgi:hypothetical protein